jgi:hypothetical protein
MNKVLTVLGSIAVIFFGSIVLVWIIMYVLGRDRKHE